MGRLFENTNLVERRDAGIGEHTIDRVVTVPNAITLVRALAIPLFLLLLFTWDSPGGAGFLLGSLAATDWVDGYVARRFNQGSTFGKMFDPIVDRLLLVVGIVASMIAGAPPMWYAWLVLGREVLVSSWVVGITALGAKRMDVTWWGKCAAFANMGAFPAFLLADEPTFSDGVATAWTVFAWLCAVPGIVFGILSAVQYVPLGRRALREGRADREPADESA